MSIGDSGKKAQPMQNRPVLSLRATHLENSFHIFYVHIALVDITLYNSKPHDPLPTTASVVLGIKTIDENPTTGSLRTHYMCVCVSLSLYIYIYIYIYIYKTGRRF
jgi:hypothetical protein